MLSRYFAAVVLSILVLLLYCLLLSCSPYLLRCSRGSTLPALTDLDSHLSDGLLPRNCDANALLSVSVLYFVRLVGLIRICSTSRLTFVAVWQTAIRTCTVVFAPLKLRKMTVY
ncbi:hypothetical protein BD626DRAFT_228423 [Schizophyllum amplum]|uniref:Uncharacterized protein n=1 Tax=Schizophyllum amplum TaxID=97359 RepID=A0A550BWP2_9AGAR|nr:hypothetical protein BD626DRAFT_228423 [Auriculariopsis ampla]